MPRFSNLVHLNTDRVADPLAAWIALVLQRRYATHKLIMANTFSLEIDPLSTDSGWMHCWLVLDGQRHYLDATSVFPPFGNVLAFAHALAQNKLPHEFFWDEEAHGAKFQVLLIAPDNPRFHLLINHDGEIVVDVVFHLHAEASEEPQHFQLKIIVLHPKVEPETRQTILDAVLDRRQFVSAFAQAFKQFLGPGSSIQ